VRREVCLAAGMLTDVTDPLERIAVAADAGFDGLGLRVDEGWPDTTDLGRVRELLDRRRMTLLDVELVMVTADGRHEDQAQRALAVAQRLRPGHLVTVCFDDDHARLVAALRRLVHALEGTGVRPVVEFLPFSSIRTLDEACSLVAEADADGSIGVLVDVLHLVRSGGAPADLATVAPELLPYLQVCDAGQATLPVSRGALFREAVGGRLLPGDGTLPVAEVIARFPAGAPLSVEVLSDDLMRHTEPRSRARIASDATRAMLLD
jgi:sugar phosphate isomerase/epimerase